MPTAHRCDSMSYVVNKFEHVREWGGGGGSLYSEVQPEQVCRGGRGHSQNIHTHMTEYISFVTPLARGDNSFTFTDCLQPQMHE